MTRKEAFISKFCCNECGYIWEGSNARCLVCEYIQLIQNVMLELGCINSKETPTITNKKQIIQIDYEKFPNLYLKIDCQSSMGAGIWVNNNHAAWSLDLTSRLLKECL